MLSCSSIQQSATPACRREGHSFIAGPVLQPHPDVLDTIPFWKKKNYFKPLPDLVLSAAGKVIEGWYKDLVHKTEECHATGTGPRSSTVG